MPAVGRSQVIEKLKIHQRSSAKPAIGSADASQHQDLLSASEQIADLQWCVAPVAAGQLAVAARILVGLVVLALANDHQVAG